MEELSTSGSCGAPLRTPGDTFITLILHFCVFFQSKLVLVSLVRCLGFICSSGKRCKAYFKLFVEGM